MSRTITRPVIDAVEDHLLWVGVFLLALRLL